MDDGSQNKQGVLKKEMIFQKTRTQNLKDVRTLNMWGYELQDISIVSNLTNVETISFPINKIQTLEPFQTCRNLHNLLLRQNLISDINEIQYLTCLPYLTNLTLAENPIASLPGYRETVISILPQLEKLDDVDVSKKAPAKIQKKLQQQQPNNKKHNINKKKQPQFYENNDDEFFVYDDDDDDNKFPNMNKRQKSSEYNNFNNVAPVKKQFNILEKIDLNQPAQTFKKPDKKQTRTNCNQTYNPSYNNFPSNGNFHNFMNDNSNNNNYNDNNYNDNNANNSPAHHSPTNALDEHLLTAVLSLIPELSVESLQIVLEAIRDRCK